MSSKVVKINRSRWQAKKPSNQVGDVSESMLTDDKQNVMKESGNQIDQHVDKGFLNPMGANNCFLNAALQALYYDSGFRSTIGSLECHNCVGDLCVLCDLKAIFHDYGTSHQKVVSTDRLRVTLSSIYSQLQKECTPKFQIGEQNDAMEVLNAILSQIHLRTEEIPAADLAEHLCWPRCIAHKNWAFMLQNQCQCHVLETNQNFIEEIPVFTILKPESTTSWELIVKNHQIAQRQEIFMACNADYKLMEFQSTITIGIQWPTAANKVKLSMKHIFKVWSRISDNIDISQMFVNTLPLVYKLTRIICFAGFHYIAITYNEKEKVWKRFDDADIKLIGPEWADVVQYCLKNKWQPSGLFYSRPDGVCCECGLISGSSESCQGCMPLVTSMPTSEPVQVERQLDSEVSKESHVSTITNGAAPMETSLIHETPVPTVKMNPCAPDSEMTEQGIPTVSLVSSSASDSNKVDLLSTQSSAPNPGSNMDFAMEISTGEGGGNFDRMEIDSVCCAQSTTLPGVTNIHAEVIIAPGIAANSSEVPTKTTNLVIPTDETVMPVMIGAAPITPSAYSSQPTLSAKQAVLTYCLHPACEGKLASLKCGACVDHCPLGSACPVKSHRNRSSKQQLNHDAKQNSALASVPPPQKAFAANSQGDDRANVQPSEKVKAHVNGQDKTPNSSKAEDKKCIKCDNLCFSSVCGSCSRCCGKFDCGDKKHRKAARRQDAARAPAEIPTNQTPTQAAVETTAPGRNWARLNLLIGGLVESHKLLLKRKKDDEPIGRKVLHYFNTTWDEKTVTVSYSWESDYEKDQNAVSELAVTRAAYISVVVKAFAPIFGLSVDFASVITFLNEQAAEFEQEEQEAELFIPDVEAVDHLPKGSHKRLLHHCFFCGKSSGRAYLTRAAEGLHVVRCVARCEFKFPKLKGKGEKELCCVCQTMVPKESRFSCQAERHNTCSTCYFKAGECCLLCKAKKDKDVPVMVMEVVADASEFRQEIARAFATMPLPTMSDLCDLPRAKHNYLLTPVQLLTVQHLIESWRTQTGLTLCNCPGSGKTRIWAVAVWWVLKFVPCPVMVILKKSNQRNIANELTQCTNLSVLVVSGTADRRLALLDRAYSHRPQVWIVTKDRLQQESDFEDIAFSVLIAEEMSWGHNHNNQAWQAFAKIQASRILAVNAFALSGDPENSLPFWSLLNYKAMPASIWPQWHVGFNAARVSIGCHQPPDFSFLEKFVKDMTVLLSSDILRASNQLPLDHVTLEVKVNKTQEEAIKIETHKTQRLHIANKATPCEKPSKSRSNIKHTLSSAAALLRKFIEQSSKLNITGHLLTDWCGKKGRKLAIYCFGLKYGMNILDNLLEVLGIAYVRIDGGLSEAQRQARINKFEAIEGAAVLIVSIRAASEGVNIRSAQLILLFDFDWNPLYLLQLERRADRYGSIAGNTVINLVAADSEEEFGWQRVCARGELIVEATRSLTTEVVVDQRPIKLAIHLELINGAQPSLVFQVAEDSAQLVQILMEVNGRKEPHIVDVTTTVTRVDVDKHIVAGANKIVLHVFSSAKEEVWALHALKKAGLVTSSSITNLTPAPSINHRPLYTVDDQPDWLRERKISTEEQFKDLLDVCAEGKRLISDCNVWNAPKLRTTLEDCISFDGFFDKAAEDADIRGEQFDRGAAWKMLLEMIEGLTDVGVAMFGGNGLAESLIARIVGGRLLLFTWPKNLHHTKNLVKYLREKYPHINITVLILKEFTYHNPKQCDFVLEDPNGCWCVGLSDDESKPHNHTKLREEEILARVSSYLIAHFHPPCNSISTSSSNTSSANTFKLERSNRVHLFWAYFKAKYMKSCILAMETVKELLNETGQPLLAEIIRICQAHHVPLQVIKLDARFMGGSASAQNRGRCYYILFPSSVMEMIKDRLFQRLFDPENEQMENLRQSQKSAHFKLDEIEADFVPELETQVYDFPYYDLPRMSFDEVVELSETERFCHDAQKNVSVPVDDVLALWSSMMEASDIIKQHKGSWVQVLHEAAKVLDQCGEHGIPKARPLGAVIKAIPGLLDECLHYASLATQTYPQRMFPRLYASGQFRLLTQLQAIVDHQQLYDKAPIIASGHYLGTYGANMVQLHVYLNGKQLLPLPLHIVKLLMGGIDPDFPIFLDKDPSVLGQCGTGGATFAVFMHMLSTVMTMLPYYNTLYSMRSASTSPINISFRNSVNSLQNLVQMQASPVESERHTFEVMFAGIYPAQPSNSTFLIQTDINERNSPRHTNAESWTVMNNTSLSHLHNLNTSGRGFLPQLFLFETHERKARAAEVKQHIKELSLVPTTSIVYTNKRNLVWPVHAFRDLNHRRLFSPVTVDFQACGILKCLSKVFQHTRVNGAKILKAVLLHDTNVRLNKRNEIRIVCSDPSFDREAFKTNVRTWGHVFLVQVISPKNATVVPDDILTEMYNELTSVKPPDTLTVCLGIYKIMGRGATHRGEYTINLKKAVSDAELYDARSIHMPETPSFLPKSMVLMPGEHWQTGRYHQCNERLGRPATLIKMSGGRCSSRSCLLEAIPKEVDVDWWRLMLQDIDIPDSNFDLRAAMLLETGYTPNKTIKIIGDPHSGCGFVQFSPFFDNPECAKYYRHRPFRRSDFFETETYHRMSHVSIATAPGGSYNIPHNHSGLLEVRDDTDLKLLIKLEEKIAAQLMGFPVDLRNGQYIITYFDKRHYMYAHHHSKPTDNLQDPYLIIAPSFCTNNTHLQMKFALQDDESDEISMLKEPVMDLKDNSCTIMIGLRFQTTYTHEVLQAESNDWSLESPLATKRVTYVGQTFAKRGSKRSLGTSENDASAKQMRT